jgi:glycosyltransferase involved in cell wall biosynthesis
VFREAQVFFNVHGRLMPVVCAQPPQVMHWTYPVPLYVQGARNLYTIHDLIPLSDPALTSIAPGRHRRLLRQIADRAHRLVAVSETMRRAIIAELGCDPAAVVNTYQAAITPLQRDPALPAGLKPGGFFIVCGTVEPRKNIAALIAAHAEAATSLPLVVVGPSAAGAEAVEAAIRVAPHVIRLPWQPRPVLLGLIRRARALLFPTLAEGFGLPIIEAMSLGAPVMTSFRGAPAEVAGSAALLIDPEHRSAMAAAIADLATNDALCAQLRASGFERARMFAPAAYQRRLRALYADALSTTPGAATGSQP